MVADKVRENRLRRMADRQGLRLLRSRARDPRDITYGGYQLVDLETGGCSFGWGNANRGYAATLDEVEEFLTGEPEETPRAARKSGRARRGKK